MAQKIITFANHKGGVSKTTSTASIGACMAMKGKKVLLIDLDGQANLTLYFIPNEDEIEMSIFDSLVNGVPLPVKHIRENLAIVPSSLEMASAEIALTNLLARERLLSNLLEPVRKDYDYILIDCPPSLGIVTTNAFIAADEIIVPMTPELLPLKGMRMLDAFVTTLQRVKPSLRLGGVFIARFNHRKLNKVVEQAVKERYESITMKNQPVVAKVYSSMIQIPTVQRIILHLRRKFFHVTSNNYGKKQYGHSAWQYSGQCRYQS